MVTIKLTNHLQINNLLYKHQYGFQRGKSTEQNLLHVVNFVQSALNKGNFCIGVFLDLKKAFDVCSHDILLKKLNKLGIGGTALEWFKSYLLNRVQKVDINGKFSTEKTLNISVLQGTILGPILFLCYINDIFTVTDMAAFLFADDTSLLAENKNLNELTEYVNGELHKIANWFRSNKMAVNVSKTKYIIFRTRGMKIMEYHALYFNNNEINKAHDPLNVYQLERVYLDHPANEHQTYKLLGVHFNEYLNFNKHCNYVSGKIANQSTVLKELSINC